MPNLERTELEVKGEPVPKVRGNLPPVRDEGTGKDKGREVKAPPMEWSQRGNPKYNFATTYQFGPWDPPPKPPEGVDPGRTMSDSQMAEFKKPYPEKWFKYNEGGMVKHGSSTRVACKNKHR